MKYYPQRYDSYGGKSINAVIRWTPQFLESIERRYGINGEFNSIEVGDLFKHIFSTNAARLKLMRMYKQGWFHRKPYKKRYIYQFSNGAKKYSRCWGGFSDGPLITARLPQVIEKTKEVRRELFSSDRYVGEI